MAKKLALQLESAQAPAAAAPVVSPSVGAERPRLAIPCTVCGGPACTIVQPEIPAEILMLAKPIVRVIQLKMGVRSGDVAAGNPLAMALGNPAEIAAAVDARCAACSCSTPRAA